MSRSRTSSDGWDEIFDDLILETEPPTRYIKDAVIVTKNGARFKVSPDDFADIVAREKLIGPENSDIYSCSLSIDFTKIKRDVNRWTNKFIDNVEKDAFKMVEQSEADRKSKSRRSSTSKKPPAKKVD